VLCEMTKSSTIFQVINYELCNLIRDIGKLSFSQDGLAAAQYARNLSELCMVV